MIAVDSNILVYAHRTDSTWHKKAKEKVDGLFGGKDPWVIPWPCAHEFLAVVTNGRIYRDATPVETAFEQLKAWMESASVLMETEGSDHYPVLRDLVIRGVISGAMIHDARVAAICLSCGVDEIWTADRDYLRFPQIKVINPLVAQ